MDVSNGRIYDLSDMEDLRRRFKDGDEEAGRVLKRLKMMEVAPTTKQLLRAPARVGRNEPCPCGSGGKFKRCCFTGGCDVEEAER